MDDKTREEYERDLAVAILAMWLLYESIQSVRSIDFREFGGLFNQHVRPILSRVYGMARNTLANTFGVDYPSRPDGNGGVVISLPNLQAAMDRFQQTLWDSFTKRWASRPATQPSTQPPNQQTTQPPATSPAGRQSPPPATSPQPAPQPSQQPAPQNRHAPEPEEPAPLYTEADAERTAVTSVTDANSQGEMDAARDVESRAGTRLVAIWRAEPGACPQCAPLNGTTQRVWVDPPPKHPNCRCSLEWRPLI